MGESGIQRNRSPQCLFVLKTKWNGEVKMQSCSAPVELFCLHLESQHEGLTLRISRFFLFHLWIAGSPVKPSGFTHRAPHFTPLLL